VRAKQNRKSKPNRYKNETSHNENPNATSNLIPQAGNRGGDSIIDPDKLSLGKLVSYQRN